MFSNEELLLIYQDQNDALANVHFMDEMCDELDSCPPDHFDNEDIEDIFMRQNIMKKIREILSNKLE